MEREAGLETFKNLPALSILQLLLSAFNLTRIFLLRLSQILNVTTRRTGVIRDLLPSFLQILSCFFQRFSLASRQFWIILERDDRRWRRSGVSSTSRSSGVGSCSRSIWIEWSVPFKSLVFKWPYRHPAHGQQGLPTPHRLLLQQALFPYQNLLNLQGDWQRNTVSNFDRVRSCTAHRALHSHMFDNTPVPQEGLPRPVVPTVCDRWPVQGNSISDYWDPTVISNPEGAEGLPGVDHTLLAEEEEHYSRMAGKVVEDRHWEHNLWFVD